MNLQQIISRASIGLMGLLGFTLFSSSASAQVFDPGPSDPALFSNVINLPPDPDLGDFTTLLGTQVNVSDGGAIGSNFFADFGTEVNISGGTVGDVFNASSDSEVNISGGTVGDFFFITGEVSISGGTVGSGFADFLSGDVELIGGEFQVDGVPVVGTTFDLFTDNVTFTGTLADGSTFIFSSVNDLLTEVTLTPAVLPALDLSPIVVSTSDPNLPSGLRSGQTLTLSDGGELGANFEVVGATFNVEGGVLGAGAGSFNSTVNISGGSVGERFNAFSGSEVNISGGAVGNFFDAEDGSEVNISGGSVGTTFDANPGSVVNISGGSVSTSFDAFAESVVNISGGSIGAGFDALAGSTVNISGGSFPSTLLGADAGSTINLFGTDFSIDGDSLNNSLTANTPFTIVQRTGTLTGVLSDGSELFLDLEPVLLQDGLVFLGIHPDATLTLTLVPEIILGDCDLDGDVDFFDISPFIGFLASETFLAQADVNQDGEVNFFDIAPLIAILADS